MPQYQIHVFDSCYRCQAVYTNVKYEHDSICVVKKIYNRQIYEWSFNNPSIDAIPYWPYTGAFYTYLQQLNVPKNTADCDAMDKSKTIPGSSSIDNGYHIRIWVTMLEIGW